MAVTERPLLRQPHRHFRLRVGAFGYRMHLIKLKLRLVRHQRRIALKIASTGPLPVDCVVTCSPSMSSVSVADLRAHGAGDHRQRQHLDAVVRVRDFLVDQRLDVLVVDLLLLVGQRLEAHEGIFKLVGGRA